jgi:hypothetical protein
MSHDSSPDFVREVNENIADLGKRFGFREETLELMCECGDGTCSERLAIAASEYERLRAARCRVVLPGHHRNGSVLESADGYVAVGV